MRYLLVLLALALPAEAQAPHEVRYACKDGVCLVAQEDWDWIVKAMKAKDEEIARLNRGCGPWRYD